MHTHLSELLLARAELFAANILAMRDNFIWHDPSAKRLAALVYTLAGKPVDLEALRQSHEILKNQTGAFSTFRGSLAIYSAAALATSNQPPEALMARAITAYDLLKKQGFYANNHLVAAALEIAVNTTDSDQAHIVTRTRAFFNEMKANHRFRIGQEDVIMAATLAMSDIEPHEGAIKMKRLFQQMKGQFSAFSGRGSHLKLAQLMVLNKSTEHCVSNLAHLNRNLRQQKIKLDRSYTLSTLGMLGLLDISHHNLAFEIKSLEEKLRREKGLGYWSIFNTEMMLYVVAMIVSIHLPEDNTTIAKASMVTSVISLLVATRASAGAGY